MDVIKVTPRGYCYGVVDAIELVKQTARNPNVPRPIYILGLIVHNRHIVEELGQLGVISLDGEDRLALVEQIEAPATVIFTAHGVSPAVRVRAREKGLHVVDATCPDVTRTHDLIRELVAQGYEIFYIGKPGHPEPEGAVGVAPGHVYLISSAADVERVQPRTAKLAVTNQTTMSQWDTADLMRRLQERFPEVQIYNEICMATQLRQEAVARQAPEADLVLVVGDPRSNNSNRLAQVAEEIAGREAHLVDSVQDIQPEWLAGRRRVAITSGASTPTRLTREVIRFVEQYQSPEPAGPRTSPKDAAAEPAGRTGGGATDEDVHGSGAAGPGDTAGR